MLFALLFLLGGADIGEWKTYYPNILGGGWVLVRRVKPGSTWHPARDQLRGKSTYGTFTDNLKADRTFSRRFDTEAFDQFLFITGDSSKWLVMDKAEALGWYDNKQVVIVASTVSPDPYRARMHRRSGKTEDPWISLVDNHKAVQRAQVLYVGDGKKRGTDVLLKHLGANVLIRQRDYKVYVSGCCDFQLQAPVHSKARLWRDRGYRFKELPTFLRGGILVRGPFKAIDIDTELDVRVTYPSDVFVLVPSEPDRRHGGFLKSLPKAGWRQMSDEARWHQNRRFYVFTKPVENWIRLPKTTTQETVISILAKRLYVEVGYAGCISEQGRHACYFERRGVTMGQCQRRCSRLDECIGWTNIRGSKCFLYFRQNSGAVKRKRFRGWQWGHDDCGGYTIKRSTGHPNDYKCFAKKMRKDQVQVKVTGDPRFGPGVPATAYSQIWNDEKFQFRHGLPRYLLGATLMRGPHKIPVNRVLTITVSRPSTVFLLINIDIRDGSLREKLPKLGWSLRRERTRWRESMEIYSKMVQSEVTLPKTNTQWTILSIIVKQALTEPGNLLCYHGALRESYLLQPKATYAEKFPTRESCRLHCISEFQSQGYSYFTDGNYNECRCGRAGKDIDELLTERHHGLNNRRTCRANDVSVFQWCTCETTPVTLLQSSCVGATKTGIHTLRGHDVPVYCDMDTEGGKWLLLLSQKDASKQYEGSVSPFTRFLNPNRPDPLRPYSRDWRGVGRIQPQQGDEFLLKRGSSGDFVRFVVDGTWCGWGESTKNCMSGKEEHHSFLTTGTLYDRNGDKVPEVKYFNGCAIGGNCAKSGMDGVGFGSVENHLRATAGDTGFGGAAWPGGLRWNSATVDSGRNVPYTYWFRPSENKANTELNEQVDSMLERVSGRESFYHNYLKQCAETSSGGADKVKLEMTKSDSQSLEKKYTQCQESKDEREKYWRNKQETREGFWKQKLEQCENEDGEMQEHMKNLMHTRLSSVEDNVQQLKGRRQDLKQNFGTLLQDANARVKKQRAKYYQSRERMTRWQKKYFQLVQKLQKKRPRNPKNDSKRTEESSDDDDVVMDYEMDEDRRRRRRPRRRRSRRGKSFYFREIADIEHERQSDQRNGFPEEDEDDRPQQRQEIITPQTEEQDENEEELDFEEEQDEEEAEAIIRLPKLQKKRRTRNMVDHVEHLGYEYDYDDDYDEVRDLRPPKRRTSGTSKSADQQDFDLLNSKTGSKVGNSKSEKETAVGEKKEEKDEKKKPEEEDAHVVHGGPHHKKKHDPEYVKKVNKNVEQTVKTVQELVGDALDVHISKPAVKQKRERVKEKQKKKKEEDETMKTEGKETKSTLQTVVGDVIGEEPAVKQKRHRAKEKQKKKKEQDEVKKREGKLKESGKTTLDNVVEGVIGKEPAVKKKREKEKKKKSEKKPDAGKSSLDAVAKDVEETLKTKPAVVKKRLKEKVKKEKKKEEEEKNPNKGKTSLDSVAKDVKDTLKAKPAVAKKRHREKVKKEKKKEEEEQKKKKSQDGEIAVGAEDEDEKEDEETEIEQEEQDIDEEEYTQDEEEVDMTSRELYWRERKFRDEARQERDKYLELLDKYKQRTAACKDELNLVKGSESKLQKRVKDEINEEKDGVQSNEQNWRRRFINLRKYWQKKFRNLRGYDEKRNLRLTTKLQREQQKRRGGLRETWKGKLAAEEEDSQIQRTAARQARRSERRMRRRYQKLKKYAQIRLAKLKKSKCAGGGEQAESESSKNEEKADDSKLLATEKRRWKTEKRMYERVINQLKDQIQGLIKEVDKDRSNTLDNHNEGEDEGEEEEDGEGPFYQDTSEKSQDKKPSKISQESQLSLSNPSRKT